MDLRPSDEQDQLTGAFAALYAKESSPERVRAAEPLGFDRPLWEKLGEMGVVAMAVDEEHGGWGASLLDLELVAEQQGRSLAAAPVTEAQVAARLLARLGGPGTDALAAAVEGKRLVSLALRPARGDRAEMVPAGAVADDLLVMVGDELRLVSPVGDRVTPENVGSLPLADLDVAGSPVLASGPDALAAYDAAIDEWLALTAGALVGIAQRSLEIGVEYVKEREAFGQKIGGFQAISHRLADSAAATDGALLLAREAAWAAAEEPTRFAELAAMAFAFAAETARDASYRSLHFHGGYGFMLEYDIQLYYRRARAWAQVGMDPRRAYRRVADRRYPHEQLGQHA
ncbi:MAG TPA: acyl-CoA dehydrogenase family protein [Acidimicrobiales bacterium]